MSGRKAAWWRWRKWIIGTLVAGGVLLLALMGLANMTRAHQRTGVAVRLSVEVRSVGVARFVEKIDPALSTQPDSQKIDLAKVENLSADFKEEFSTCEVIGERSKPQGLLVTRWGGGTFYLSLDGAGLPALFAGYKNRPLYGDVYQIYQKGDFEKFSASAFQRR